MQPCPYVVTKLVTADGFPGLTVTFTPLPLHEVAAAETREKAAARKAARAKCRQLGLKADAKGDAEEDYRDAFDEAFNLDYYAEQAKTVAKQLGGWDLVRGGAPVVADADGVLSLPYPVFTALRAVVLGYAAGLEVAADAKKSPSPHG